MLTIVLYYPQSETSTSLNPGIYKTPGLVKKIPNELILYWRGDLFFMSMEMFIYRNLNNNI